MIDAAFFDDEGYYTGPAISDTDIRSAEQSLGVTLPASYLQLIAIRNGGVPTARCYPTDFANSWAADHISIDAICGIGGTWGIDSDELGSRVMMSEWGYPDIGVVICSTPSGGHDTVMLDYRASGPTGEPAVAHIDEDRVPRQIAASFAEFIDGLTACDIYENNDE